MIKSVGSVPKVINDLSLSEERKRHSFSVIRLGSRPLIFQPSQLFFDSSDSVHTCVCMWCSWTATFSQVNYAATASLSACTMAQSSGSPLLSRLRWPISGQFIMRLLLQRMMSIVSIAFVSVGSDRSPRLVTVIVCQFRSPGWGPWKWLLKAVLCNSSIWSTCKVL